MLQVQITSNNGLRDNHIESGFSVFLWKTKSVDLKSVFLKKVTVRSRSTPDLLRNPGPFLKKD